LSSRRERFYSLEAPVLLPSSIVSVLDNEEDPVLIGEEMDQPIIVHLPSNALNVNAGMCFRLANHHRRFQCHGRPQIIGAISRQRPLLLTTGAQSHRFRAICLM
jgi:hypothetical protein